MYAYYHGSDQTLSSDDISGIQSIYGTIPAPSTNNRSSSTATNLTPLINGNLQIALSGQNISNSDQYDWYSVTVPSGTTGNMVVTMQSSNLSSLSPKLTIYNSASVGLGQSLALNTYGATVSYTVTGVQPGQVYYLRAGAAQSGAGGNGAYGLLVNFGSRSQAPIAPPNTVVAGTADQGSGSNGLSVQLNLDAGSTVLSLSAGLSNSNGSGLWFNSSTSTEPTDSSEEEIQVGSLQGWGDALTIKETAGHRTHPHARAHVNSSHAVSNSATDAVGHGPGNGIGTKQHHHHA
jgi:hypothetical protein